MSTPFGENTTAWLSTTASQIFFMQLGFLCYEVGFVKPIWTQSIILKNIEDTFVGILTFLAFGFTLSESSESFYGIISVPINPLLIGVDKHLHDQILITAFFASTSATIISGAVLERMKNKAYLLWCFLIVLINYSFIAHWVWHKDGWLKVLGFVDGAGAIVVHTTAGMASLIAIWRLGPRKESLAKDGITIKPIESASRPIINTIGAFFLWYGWFAFNVSSPIAFSKGIGAAIGTTALVTVISPVCASCSAFILMYFNLVNLSFEHLLSCLLSGLVAITGPCHTCNIWEAAVIGFCSSIIYFIAAHIIRFRLHIDDPMQIVAIHLCGGIFSCVSEGIVANNVYNTPGLIYGGYKHFGVQILGVIVICVFNFIMCIFLYDIILKKLIFGDSDIKVSVLDVYLGTQIFHQDYTAALDEVLKCNTNTGKRMLFEFHKYIAARFASEQLDFLIIFNIFDNYLHSKNIEDKTRITVAKYILQIIDTYIEETGDQSINISGTTRGVLFKIKSQILNELEEEEHAPVQHLPPQQETDLCDDTCIRTPSDQSRSASLIRYKPGYYKSGLDISKENIFKSCYFSIWKMILPLFTQFLRNEFNPQKKQKKITVKMPFKLKENWIIEWDKEIQKQNTSMELVDTVPRLHDSGSLLNKKRKSNSQQNNAIQIQLEQVTVHKSNTNYDVIFESNQKNDPNDKICSASVIIE
eukprot:441107_1